MEEPIKEKISMEEWLNNILNVHGRPCYLMIGIDESGAIKLLAASSKAEFLGLMAQDESSENKEGNYIG